MLANELLQAHPSAAWIALRLVPGVGPVVYRTLVEAFRSPTAVLGAAVAELIARLAAELAQAQTQLREMTASTPDGPLLSPMRRRVAALETQIETERRKISSESGGLAQKLADYERLVLEREFAKTTLAAAVRSLESARTEARRQQLYLERVTQPAAADYPLAPDRLRMIITVLAANGLGLLVGWLIYAGVHERLSESSRG